MKNLYLIFGIVLITGMSLVITLGAIDIYLGQKVSRRICPTPVIDFDIRSNELTLENVYAEIMANDIKFSEIVLRQCIVETGWLTSRNCLVRNNLFGMTGSEKTNDNVHGYATYNNWKESVKAYKKWQQERLTDDCSDYYQFLLNWNYAESPEYISKLKSIKLIIVKTN